MRAPTAAGDHAHLAAGVTLTQGTTAIGLMRGLWAKFPLITRAMRRMKGLTEPRVLSDFPTLALVEAAQAARLQAHGYTILKESATAGAPAGGPAGVEAAYVLNHLFDCAASEAIREGDIVLDISPLEATLGVLPLLLLALHFWYRLHSAQGAAGSEVLKAAVKLCLSPGGTFDPRKGLSPFRAAWATAAGQEAILPCHEVYQALARVIAAAPSGDWATVRGARVSWDGSRQGVLAEFVDHSAEVRYTDEELETLWGDLQRFALAHGSERDNNTRLAVASVNLIGFDGGDDDG